MHAVREQSYVEPLAEVDGEAPCPYLLENLFGVGMGEKIVVEKHNVALFPGNELTEACGCAPELPFLPVHETERTPAHAPARHEAKSVCAMPVQPIVGKTGVNFRRKPFLEGVPRSANLDSVAIELLQGGDLRGCLL